MTPTQRDRLRQILPLVGTVLLIGVVAKTTDLQKFRAALAAADLWQYGLVVGISTVLVWLYDTACVTWLLGLTLAGRGQPLPWKTLLPVKAASYAINAVNYHAATLAMAWLVGKRKNVTFLEAAGALGLLSYLDLVAVAGMVATGLVVAPDVVAAQPGLQSWLQGATVLIFTAALVSVLALQSGWQLPILVRLRGLAVLRPLAEPLLRQVPHTAPEFVEARRLLAFFDWFVPIETEWVPDNSILREFVGGSILKDFKVWGG